MAVYTIIYLCPVYIYVTGVAAGLTHIHEKGILHNDVKADNIALGDCLPASKEIPVAGVWPTIIDFGKACPSKKGKKYILGPHQRKMYRSRYSHIAPDLVDGIVPQSVLSDVLSLGQIMKKMAMAGTELQRLASSCTAYSCSNRLELENVVSMLKSML